MDRFLEETYDNIEYGLEISLYLINCGCAIEEKNKAKLLCEACEIWRFDMVKELVEQHNVNPNGEYHHYAPSHWLF